MADTSLSNNASGPSASSETWMVPITEVPAEIREILENYSKVPAGEVLEHIRGIQTRAYDTYPWPCIGLHTFLNLELRQHPIYTHVLSLLRSGGKFLDAGCGLGQELRALHQAGVPLSQIHGADLEPAFIDFGHELFRDADNWGNRIVAGDILTSVPDYQLFEGKISVVNAALFLHVFGLEDQKCAARKLISWLKVEEGSMIVGAQLGVDEGARELMGPTGRSAFWHTKDSMEGFWRGLGEEMGLRWKRVDVEVVEMPPEYMTACPWPMEGVKGIRFVVERA